MAEAQRLEMMTTIQRICLAFLCLALPVPSVMAATLAPDPLLEGLSAQAPALDRKVLNHALDAMRCAINNGAVPAQRLAVIDFSKPSSERRLWIFDLTSKRVLLHLSLIHI